VRLGRRGVVALVAVVVMPLGCGSTGDGDDAWTVVWEDGFDTGALDPQWQTEHSTYGHSGGSIHCYTPANIRVADGRLVLEARRESVACADGNGTRDYTSGMVRLPRATGGAGSGASAWRVEVRMRTPEGQGLWPAAWLGPDDDTYGPWPRSGEIDVVEVLGRDPGTAVGTLHWAQDGRHHRQSAGTVSQSTGEFHVYAVEWSAEEFVWSLDGEEYHRVTSWDVPPDEATPAPFDQSFELRLNLAVGGRWPGMPDASTLLPASLSIDWVRISRR
jgi:beta-glucanase (GH16 family)